ncbi:beta-aspartyl-peptidase [Thermococcus aggregans]|uniref:Beta-aspartyl-peptidase n=1 Tax=Thermococcus aggregans TaxID=110163 RepID=A0A9E7MW91_THEAG|nr:beta-aspartyl-peptidase [Thermococcus aggregans]USS40033.1 beta-aspartyl-peptidase [Thermococcus aggregans]
MNILIKNGEIYSPEYKGKKDILVMHGKISTIKEDIPPEITHHLGDIEVIDASDSIVIPGFIDQHVHINGAGGEGGPQYRTPPVQLTQLSTVGITSVVGVLGTDGVARSLRELLMKARGLENEGISTWIYTGAYQVPSPTITGSILSDIVLIDKVIGVKMALSDHRSSHPTIDELRRIASDARVGGILSGKAGVVHIHMGSEKPGLTPILKAIENTDIPIEQFAPTHLNRCEDLFNESIEFGRLGGYVDITAGVSPEYGFDEAIKPSEAVKTLLKKGVPVDRITMSTDGNGSMPKVNEKKELVRMLIAPVSSLYKEFVDMVKEEKIDIEDAVRITSTNIAKHLKLSQKGEIKPNKDADLVILDKNTLKIKYVIARGEILVKEGKPIKFGTFE